MIHVDYTSEHFSFTDNEQLYRKAFHLIMWVLKSFPGSENFAVNKQTQWSLFHLIMCRCLVCIHDCCIIQHHVVFCQCQYAVPQSCYHFFVSRRHRLSIKHRSTPHHSIFYRPYALVCSFCAIAAAVPPRPQDGTVSVIVLFTIVSSYVTDCNF